MAGFSTTPMDYNYENGTGPMDGRSPFAQLGQGQRFPLNNKKRSYSAYDSPTKPPSPSKPLPAVPNVPALNSLFTTPRKAMNDYDDSSAGETPRSPEAQDSPATPSMSARPQHPALGRLEAAAASAPAIAGAERSSPTKERPKPDKRESWLSNQITKFKSKVNSPGRGEIARGESSAHHSGAVEKRRKREVSRKEHQRRRRLSTSSNDDDSIAQHVSPRKSSRSHTQSQPDAEPKEKEHWLATFYTFIERHPTVPHILSFYAQLFFNVFLLSCCAFAIWSAWSAFSADVDKKAHEAMNDVLAEMAVCASHYTQNRCAPETRVPAMETVCENWNKCMNQDPTRVGRAKVGATTFAEIFNSFVEPISWKTMGFTFIIVFGVFAISNFAFGLFRKTEQMGYQYQGPPPPTPQMRRQFSGQQDYYHFAGIEPQPSPVKRIDWGGERARG